MVKCPNCSKELPDGRSFCLYCCTSTVDRKLFSVSEEGGFSSFIKSRQLRVAVSCLLIVGLAFGGGMLFKKYNHGIVSVSAENTTLIPVTNENGEAVTDSSGEAVMELAVPVTDKNGEELTGVDGEKLYQSVVPVTDAQGEIVTAKGGEQVYQVASGSTENATEEIKRKAQLRRRLPQSLYRARQGRQPLRPPQSPFQPQQSRQLLRCRLFPKCPLPKNSATERSTEKSLSPHTTGKRAMLLFRPISIPKRLHT